MQVAECQLALPCLALQWHQCDSECIFVTLEIHLTIFAVKFSDSMTFLWYGTGRTDTRTEYGQTDFSRKILFQIYACISTSKQTNSRNVQYFLDDVSISLRHYFEIIVFYFASLTLLQHQAKTQQSQMRMQSFSILLLFTILRQICVLLI